MARQPTPGLLTTPTGPARPSGSGCAPRASQSRRTVANDGTCAHRVGSQRRSLSFLGLDQLHGDVCVARHRLEIADGLFAYRRREVAITDVAALDGLYVVPVEHDSG